MKNRGVCPPLAFETYEDFSKAIEQLDLDKLTPLASQKGFTVRDIDMLLIEMAAHSYYFKKNKDVIPWTTDAFVKVLENSTGSNKEETTNELILGDRFFTGNSKVESQLDFSFIKDYSIDFDEEKFKEVSFFQ